jgi:hypothetical protein
VSPVQGNLYVVDVEFRSSGVGIRYMHDSEQRKGSSNETRAHSAHMYVCLGVLVSWCAACALSGGASRRFMTSITKEDPA